MDNRTKLLDVALQLFVSRGYDAVGVQEIVEAAGVTKPTLYHYFGNKIGLLQSLADRHGEPLLSAVSQAALYQKDLPLTLNRVVNTYFTEARRDSAYHRLRLSLWMAPPDNEAGQIIVAQFRREDRLIEALFTAAEADHGNMRGRARTFATSFEGVIHSHIGQFLRTQAALDQELAFRVVHQFMHGIYS